MTMIGRATEKGLEEVGKTVLEEYFELAGDKTMESSEDNGEITKEEKSERTSYSVSWSCPFHVTCTADIR